jgi:hypothetical protein
MTHRRGSWVTAVAAAVVLAGCGTATSPTNSEGQEPIHVNDARDVKSAVAGARVTRPLLFDDGVLRIDRAPAGDPEVDEAQAIRYLRAAALPASYVEVSDVVVAYGRATLRGAVDLSDMTVRPAHSPEFSARPAWLLVHENGVHGCPAMQPGTDSPSPGVPAREPLPVEVIAADGSGEAVAYSTAGTFCGTSVQPKARPASYTLSVPWTQADPQTDGTATVTATAPECGTISGYVGPGRPDTTVAVGATVLMVRSPCQGDGGPGGYDAPTRGVLLKHAPTGLVTGMYTDGRGEQFTYYDGTERSES